MVGILTCDQKFCIYSDHTLPPQAQDLNKSPGKIGLTLTFDTLFCIACSRLSDNGGEQKIGASKENKRVGIGDKQATFCKEGSLKNEPAMC